MKINKINLSNINALRGEHTIDFQSTPLSDSELIAIVGETGSGKTTLLDAILLALYNQTPRYPKVTNTELDQSGGILTKGESKGHVAIDFELLEDGKSQYYRAKWWAQKGSRGEAKNRINKCEMEFARLESDQATIGALIESGNSRKVCPIIEETIGLNYEQFVKGVMLAQGDFSKLLKAKKTERNQLLEKITRSFDFRKISQKVYEAYKERQKALELLEQQLGNIPLMNAEEVKALEIELKKLQSEVENHLQKLQSIEKQHLQLKEYQQVQLQATQIKVAQNKLQARKAEIEPDIAQLAKFEKALPLKADYEKLKDQQVRIVKNKEEQGAIQLKTEAEKTAYQQIEFRLKEGFRLKKALDAQSPLVQQQAEEMRAQDESLKLTGVQISSFQNQHKEILNRLDAEQQALKNGQLALQQFQLELQAFQEEEKSLSYLEEIAPQLSHWRQLSSNINHHSGQLKNEIQGFEEAKLQQALLAAFEKGEIKTTIQRWQLALDRQLEELQSQRKWKLEEERLLQAQKILDKIQAEKTELNGEYATQQQLQQELSAKETLLQHLLSESEKAEKQWAYSKAQVKITEGELEKAKLEHDHGIAYFRSQLKEGAACPVCGSTAHPAAHKKTDQQIIQLAQEKHQHQKKEEEQHLQQLSALQRQSAAAKEGKQIGEQNLAQIEVKISQRKQSLSDLQGQLPEAFGGTLHHEQLSEEIHASLENLKTYQKKEMLRQPFQRIANMASQYENALQDFHQATAPFQGHLQGAIQLEQLEKEWTKCQQLRKEIALSQQKIEHAQSQTAEKQQVVKQLEKEQETLLSAIRKESDKLNLQQQKRQSKYGTLTADQFQQAHQEQLNQQNQEVSTLQLKQQESGQKLKTFQEHTDRLATELKTLAEQQHQLQFALTTSLEKSEIPDLNTLEEILAFEPAAEEVRANQKKLQTEIISLQEQEKINQEKKEAITHFFEGNIPEEQELLEKKQGKEKQIKDLQNQQSDLQASLKVQIQQQKEQANLLVQIQKQQKDIRLWKALNDMIGSKEGDKFNNYAQSLMLGILLEYANNHLRLLSPRYRFISQPDGTNEDDLYIMDMEMGDEIRAIKTLSGGETFLLALSMALGLSDMASRKVKIESLFIDEGFGTLDKNTLEEVLSTLENLQYQTGKKIVIISHVPELQERISTQIKLEKQGAGYSAVKVIA
ncbi:AAA family ATPase [Persicobacter diffluens]|uniref:Rad50/SbcC-type AAA domain-containing protein n=1 Tax=Persicobacter diffluens TaxID=981 RepID=A0AAN4W3R0_9BACT|nr:hypothetical protein PEDI_39770 [Persicobacter diffluens]